MDTLQAQRDKLDAYQAEIDQLHLEMAAYERMREDLEDERFGKWVVIYNEELIGAYESFHDAACVAVERFGRGPYHIRQIGVSQEFNLPVSLLYRPVYADD